MPRSQSKCLSLTVGQLARRWGVSADRIRQLVQSGYLAGVFTIPSAGRYGATLKIPLSTVIQLETEDWAVALKKPQRAGPRSPRRRGDLEPAYKHFPKLRASLEQPASGSDGAAQD